MKSCLIVDDSAVVRRKARSIVEELSFDVTEAADGLQALARCREHLPDAILLDWNMPELDGIGFLRALRREPGGDGPVVLLCSTENDLRHIVTALKNGANEYIMKPFDRDIIEAKFVAAGLI